MNARRRGPLPETRPIATFSANDDDTVLAPPLPAARLRGGWLTKLVSLGVSLAILATLWLSAQRVDLLHSVKQIDVRYLVLALALMPMAMILRGLRLDVILGKSGRRLGLVRATILTFIGTSLNVLLPSNLGDVAKAYYGYRFSLAKEVVLSVVIIDKAFGMFAAMTVGLVAAAYVGMWKASAVAGAMALALMTLIFVPQLIPWRLLAWLMKKLLRKNLAHELALEASRLPAGIKLAAAGLSFVACGLAFTQFYLLCRALGLNVPLAYAWVAAPLMDLAKAVPLTANGLGTREAVAVVMLGRIGVPDGGALLSSLLLTAVSLWAPALVGAPFIWLSVRGKQAGADSSRPVTG